MMLSKGNHSRERYLIREQAKRLKGEVPEEKEGKKLDKKGNGGAAACTKI